MAVYSARGSIAARAFVERRLISPCAGWWLFHWRARALVASRAISRQSAAVLSFVTPLTFSMKSFLPFHFVRPLCGFLVLAIPGRAQPSPDAATAIPLATLVAEISVNNPELKFYEAEISAAKAGVRSETRAARVSSTSRSSRRARSRFSSEIRASICARSSSGIGVIVACRSSGHQMRHFGDAREAQLC